MAGQPGRPRERRDRFSTISDVEMRRVYGPVDWAAIPTGGPRAPTARPRSTTISCPTCIRCAEAYATLGEQCAVLREVFGECREPAAI